MELKKRFPNKLKEIIGDDFDLFSNYFNINDYGFWKEENKYILIRSVSDIVFINNNSLEEKLFYNFI